MWHGEVEEPHRSREKLLSSLFIRRCAKQSAETTGESVY